MTARDMQDEGKKRLPWILAKSFMAACPVSMFMSKEKAPSPHSLKLRLKVNGEGETQVGGWEIVHDSFLSPTSSTPFLKMKEKKLSFS